MHFYWLLKLQRLFCIPKQLTDCHKIAEKNHFNLHWLMRFKCPIGFILFFFSLKFDSTRRTVMKTMATIWWFFSHSVWARRSKTNLYSMQFLTVIANPLSLSHTHRHRVIIFFRINMHSIINYFKKYLSIFHFT